jgi:hypothetical protein
MALYGRMTVNEGSGNMWKETVVAPFQALTWSLCGGTEESHSIWAFIVSFGSSQMQIKGITA